jgi:DNA-binding NtrC family response regulator
MGTNKVMYFNDLYSIKLILKYIHMPLHYRSLIMARLYTHNSLRDAKEQFEIMFINDVLQDNEYSLRRSAETLGIHYSGLHRKIRHLGMPKTYRRTSK